MAEAAAGGAEEEAKHTARLRRKLRGLQSTRQALEGLDLGGQLHAARAREQEDGSRLRELERANAALEKRVAHLLLERGHVQRERARVEAIAYGLEQLKAAAAGQQRRLLDAQAEVARLRGAEAAAAAAEAALGIVQVEREGLLREVRARDGELHACLEHAEAFHTMLGRLTARAAAVNGGGGGSEGDEGSGEEGGQGQAEATALLETFFPQSTHPLASTDSGRGELWASLRGVVGEVGTLLGACRRAQARAAGQARRASALSH